MNLRTIFAFITSAALLMVAIRYWIYEPPDRYADAWIQALSLGNIAAFALNLYGLSSTRTGLPLSEQRSRTRSGVIAAFLILILAQWYVSLMLLELVIGGMIG